MAHDIRELSRRWFEEVWNKRNREAIYQLSHPEAHVFGLAEPGKAISFDGFIPFYERFVATFPDIHIHVDDVIVEGDQSVVRLRAEGTHTGDAMGIPPTGKRIAVSGLIWTRWKDGRIIQAWNEFDALGMMQQMTAGAGNGNTAPPQQQQPKIKQ
jgi:steroid delta-isomerase-like uncharacterized protein